MALYKIYDPHNNLKIHLFPFTFFKINELLNFEIIKSFIKHFVYYQLNKTKAVRNKLQAIKKNVSFSKNVNLLKLFGHFRNV